MYIRFSIYNVKNCEQVNLEGHDLLFEHALTWAKRKERKQWRIPFECYMRNGTGCGSFLIDSKRRHIKVIDDSLRR